MVRGHDIVPKYGKRITDVLKGMLRPSIIPAKGKALVVADWSSIEARMNPWLSNCVAGNAKLDLFRRGEDVYIANARATFHTQEISKDQRQIGKVQELACGFAGGVGAFGALVIALMRRSLGKGNLWRVLHETGSVSCTRKCSSSSTRRHIGSSAASRRNSSSSGTKSSTRRAI
jgi:hypothetical protein